MQLFSQGHLQATFGYTDSNVPKNDIDTQFEIIKKLLDDVQELFVSFLTKYDDIVIPKEAKQLSNKIFETVNGTIPYTKRKKFKEGDEVHIFSFKTRSWSKKCGLVKQRMPGKEIVSSINFTGTADTYKILYNGSEKIYRHSDLRRKEPNNDQVCRLNDKGIPRQPYPYSFYGICPGGYNQMIKSVISRLNNRYYPTCVDIENYDALINFLLNGFTDIEKRELFLDKMINGIDIYCGTFKPGTAILGSIVDVDTSALHTESDAKLTQVQIIDKYKTHGNGNDNNEVIYKVVKTDDEDEEIFEVRGSSFSPEYLENRYFDGILKSKDKMDKIMDKLVKCARKLHLFYEDHGEILLSSQNIHEIQNPDDVIVIPEYVEDCVKMFLIFSEEKSFILSNNNFSIDKNSRVIRGYLSETRFYPIDNADNFYYNSFIYNDVEYEYVRDNHDIKLINDSILLDYDNLPYVIIFRKNDTFYKWCTLRRRRIVMKISHKSNKYFFDSPKLSEFNINQVNEDQHIKMKPNVMNNGLINPNSPILDLETTDENISRKDFIDFCLYPLNIMTFRDI